MHSFYSRPADQCDIFLTTLWSTSKGEDHASVV